MTAPTFSAAPAPATATATATELPTALRDRAVWIFDLDNTLYPASCNLFAQVDRRINEFIAAHFNIGMDEARVRQKQFFRDYGTTLRGLMSEHDVDPVAYMDYVHDIDVTGVQPSAQLADALDRLPGRKIIYTNGSVRHAENVAGRLGIIDRFEAVFDITAAGYVPKPDPRPYASLVERHGVNPADACMVEDIARNLAPAHALGMTTVWVRGEQEYEKAGVGAGVHIDHTVDDLPSWLAAVAGL
ncbi:pyrimidine 5'-nucleotidase [Azospirillum humicireducens]|uniref:Pyrimidine 5'-nucleotidase n=1 Tax=Azospirillum humicireducens TaxID=1226968 RepID=A0A160JDB9_9PROT|nr:pyrimidine 5'-nucleotidase [Azospirillum humicireducens]ANC90680.1 pyrimidine 5'-nucleotidase [Azospirillum humicireducens]